MSTMDALKQWLPRGNGEPIRLQDLPEAYPDGPRLTFDVELLKRLADEHGLPPSKMLRISTALLGAPITGVCQHKIAGGQGQLQDCLGDLQVVMRPAGTYLECQKDRTHVYRIA